MLREERLSRFLGDAFTPAELLRELRHHPGTSGLEMEMPSPERPPAEFSCSVVELLRRHGCIDTTLFRRLASARPHRTAEIAVISAEWTHDSFYLHRRPASEFADPSLHEGSRTITLATAALRVAVSISRRLAILAAIFIAITLVAIAMNHCQEDSGWTGSNLLGARCVEDTDCVSKECQLFTCVDRNFKRHPLREEGEACKYHGDCRSASCVDRLCR